MVETRSVGDTIFEFFNYLFFILFTLICVFPFYYLLINTISDNALVARGVINFYPRGLHLKNYIALRNVSGFGTSALVTIARTVIVTILSTMASGLVGFLVTKQEMWHRKFWYRFMIVTMYFNAGLIPWFTTMQMLGLTNNFLGYVIPGIVSVYNIIMVKTYIESIPMELQESAELDGASYWVIFTRIIWPLSVPILATIAIWVAVGQWNSLQDSLVLMSGAPNLKTLQERLYLYLTQSSNLAASMGTATTGLSEAQRAAMLNTKSIQYTIAMVTAIPILCVYPFMQRYFVKGLMLGAVKG